MAPLENFSFFKTEVGNRPRKAKGRPKDPGGPDKRPGKGGGGKRRPASAAGSMIRMVQATLRATTGTQDFTVAGFGTCVAALFIMSTATTIGLPRNNLMASVGAADGTNQWVCTGTHTHNVSIGTSDRRGATDEVLMFINSSGSVVQEANFDSFITDGVRINLAVTDGFTRAVTVYLIGGGATAACGTGALGGSGATVTFAPGIESDVLIIAHMTLHAIDDTVKDASSFGLGYGTWDGATILQSSFIGINANTTEGDPRAQVTDDTIVAFHDTRQATLGNITTTEFDLTSSADDLTGADIGFLSINIGAATAWTGILTSPTTTGEHAFTGVGFTPKFGMITTTMLTDLDVVEVDAKAGAYGLGGFVSTSEEFSNSWADEDNSATIDAQGNADTKSINMDEHDGTDAYEANFVAFTNDGVTLDFTVANSTARLWPSLFIG